MANTQLDTKEKLELFVEKVEKLKNYIAHTNHFGGLPGVIRDTPEDQWRTFPELEGFLLTFRLFLQSTEGIAIYPIPKHGQPKPPEYAKLSSLSDSWYTSVKHAYEKINQVLIIEQPGLTYNGEAIPRWKILNVFIYGEYSHATLRESFKQWQQSSDLYAKLIFELPAALGFIFFEYIMPLAEEAKQELRRIS
jgi:hypothetical protein